MSFRPLRSVSAPPPRADSTVPMRDQLRAAVAHPIPGHGADLSVLERFVLTKVDGRRSVTDLAGLVEICVDEALAIVLSLLERGAVRLEGGAKAPPRRTASGVRPRTPRPAVEPAAVTLGDDDFEILLDLDEHELSDDPAHAEVFSAPTLDGTMRALTPEQAERLVALATEAGDPAQEASRPAPPRRVQR